MSTPDLDARYGRTPANRGRTRAIIVAAALAGTAVVVAWLVWGGLLEAPAQLQAVDTAHEVIDDSTVSVTWQLNVPPGSATKCAVQALNSTFAIVGWKVVDVAPSDTRTRQFTEQLLTTEPAVTGLIYRCWLT